jgi:anti-sigma factor ChrR (cupin superfamily)
VTLSAHPSTGVLSDYASGALRTAPGVVVVAHLQFCPSCRLVVQTFEEVGGAFLRGSPPEHVGLPVLGRVLRGIEEGARPPGSGSSRRALDQRTSPVGVKFGARRLLGPGCWFTPICVSHRRDWGVFLFRTVAAPPPHGWPRTALVCVLAGGFRRGARTYRIGDFGIFPSADFRRSAALPGGPLVALVAAKWSRTHAWLRRSSLG